MCFKKYVCYLTSKTINSLSGNTIYKHLQICSMIFFEKLCEIYLVFIIEYRTLGDRPSPSQQYFF